MQCEERFGLSCICEMRACMYCDHLKCDRVCPEPVRYRIGTVKTKKTPGERRGTWDTRKRDRGSAGTTNTGHTGHCTATLNTHGNTRNTWITQTNLTTIRSLGETDLTCDN